jgi:hypothetical protein
VPGEKKRLLVDARRFSKEMEMGKKIVGAVIVCVGFVFAHSLWLARDVPVTSAADEGTEIAKLKAEIGELKGRLPSQSHAMMDVDYHFSNLWFAGQGKNWPLAQFYLNETRSHLRWAVRIIPVRRIPGGEIDLRGLLEAVDSTGLAAIGKAIADKNGDAFTGAYRRTLDGCYSCHKASDKPYLRPRIPEQPESRIINFDPAATWP